MNPASRRIVDPRAGEGLKLMPFGEFLVEKNLLSREDLFTALCAQDRHPGVPLGEVIAWLGYLSYARVDALLTEWSAAPVLELD
jgi:hypothetical protein